MRSGGAMTPLRDGPTTMPRSASNLDRCRCKMRHTTPSTRTILRKIPNLPIQVRNLPCRACEYDKKRRTFLLTPYICLRECRLQICSPIRILEPERTIKQNQVVGKAQAWQIFQRHPFQTGQTCVFEQGSATPKAPKFIRLQLQLQLQLQGPARSEKRQTSVPHR